jgi:hypothetical protein
MQLKINLPYSQWNYKVSGVYQITFDDGYFYIGCSNHLKQRASGWSGVFKTGKGEPGKDIGTAIITRIMKGGSASLDILELCHPKDLKDKESFYLHKHKDDSKMLSNEAVGAWVAVLQYRPDGLFIKKHYSISGAARYIGANLYSIQRVLSGERKHCKGFVFVYEHQYHQRRREIIKNRSKKVIEKKNGRNVLMINEKGEIIKEFKKIIDAAKEVGCKSKNIARALNGFQKTAKGYIFRYA